MDLAFKIARSDRLYQRWFITGWILLGVYLVAGFFHWVDPFAYDVLGPFLIAEICIVGLQQKHRGARDAFTECADAQRREERRGSQGAA